MTLAAVAPLAWDPLAPLAALVALAAAVPGVQSVRVGVPESAPTRVFAFVTGGGFGTREKTLGRTALAVVRYRVTFAFRVMGAEDDAETTMLGVVLAFAAAVMADRSLGFPLEDGVSAEIDAPEVPLYALVAGDECRVYPTLVSVTMQRGFSPALSQ